MVLLAAVQVLMHCYTNEDDIIIGTPCSGRHYPEVNNLLGFFVNIVAIRNNFSKNPTFIDHLKTVRANVLAAYDNHDVPFEHVVDKLNIKRNLNYHPIFQVAFLLQNSNSNQLDLTRLQAEYITPNFNVSNLDLRIIAQEKNNGINVSFDYSVDLFTEPMIARMASHFLNILSCIMQEANQKIGDIEFITKEEKKLLLDWSTTKNKKINKNFIELFEKQVEVMPNKTALVFSNQKMTYRELNDKANQFAKFIKIKVTIAREQLVAIAIEKSFEFIISIIGILKAGAAYLPLDLSSPKERIQHILSDAKPILIITTKRLTHLFSDFIGNVLFLEEQIENISQYSKKNLLTNIVLTDLAYVIYTSGSTGKPKGVMIEHKGISNLAVYQSQVFGINQNSNVLQFAPTSFDASVSEWCTSLATGATLYLPAAQVSNDSLINILSRNPITHVTLPPSVANVLPTEVINALHTLIIAGEGYSNELISKFSNKLNLINAYGPTELTVCATSTSELAKHPINNIGKPLSNICVYILDKYRRLCPIGAIGEIYIGGVGLSRGYINQPELTTELFLLNPFTNDPADKLFKTGDLGYYQPDGSIQFSGRVDHQVKIRGFRIELSEIENSIKSFGFIQTCFVTSTQNLKRHKQLVAYLVFKENLKDLEKINNYITEVKQGLKEHLPAYMYPHFVIPI
ncbi:MAG: amino acid adenylation domain-containing protein, partial [Burkholderiales bacterium]|nr:amino acid adenylation domain-containing protein [Burkholderiales bacterium]